MPATIPGTPNGFDLGISPFAVVSAQYGSSHYLFLHQGYDLDPSTFANIFIFKSTDGGVSWNEVTHFLPPSAGGTPIANVSYTTCQDGSNVYILYTDSSGSSSLTEPSGPTYVRVFDLLTDTLGVENLTSLQVYKSSSGFRSNINVVRRGTGDMLITYSSLPYTSGLVIYRRVSVVGFDGSDIVGSATELPDQGTVLKTFTLTAAIVDDGDILHVLVARTARDILHYGMDNLGAFGTTQVLTTNAAISQTTSRIIAYSGSIAFLVAVGFDGDKGVFHAASGNVTPVWDEHDLTSFTPVVPSAVLSPELPCGIGYVAPYLHIYWTRSGSSPNWNHNDGLGVIQHSKADVSDLATWAAEDTAFPTPSPDFTWQAGQVTATPNASAGVDIYAYWSGDSVAPPGDIYEIGQVFLLTGTSLGITFDNAPGVVSVPYSDFLIGVGGTPPYVAFTLLVGGLPPGLSLVAGTGEIHGTPTTVGHYPFTAQVEDSVGTLAQGDFFIDVSCPTITLGVSGSGCIQASGGVPPYTYTVIAGTLPTGLTLNPVTGCFDGTTTDTGTYHFTAQAACVDGCLGTQNFSMTVGGGPSSVGFTVCETICCSLLMGLGSMGRL